MPRTPIDYNNTFIYQLISKDPDIIETYIGHTTQFVSRKNSHKTCCNNPNSKKFNLNVYQYIRENGGWDNFNMIMVEQFTCANVFEAKSKEQSYIKSLHSTLNSNTPNRTIAGWYQDNKERKYETNKKRNEINKVEIAKKSKIKYEANKKEISQRIKQFRIDNREHCLKQEKESRERRKAKKLATTGPIYLLELNVITSEIQNNL